MAVFALACLAFWSQARLGELLFEKEFNPTLARGSITFSVTSSNRKYGKCWLPRTKTKPNHDWILFTDSECANSAYRALKIHVLTNSRLSEDVPLLPLKPLTAEPNAEKLVLHPMEPSRPLDLTCEQPEVLTPATWSTFRLLNPRLLRILGSRRVPPRPE